MNSDNPTPSAHKAPRWALLLFGLPAFGFMVTIMSIEASVLAKLQTPDLSSLFKVTFNTADVIPTAVFKPALERAGYNLSNSSISTRFSAHLSHHYEFQDNKYAGCSSSYYSYFWYGRACETPKVMEGSVFSDFPRQFLFNATHAIEDKMTNASIRLQSPDDIVPLMPEGYMNEMFEEVRNTHKKFLVGMIVIGTIGVAVVIVNISVCVIKGTRIGLCAWIVLGNFFVQTFVNLALALNFSILDVDISTSKAEKFFSNNYNAWGLTLTKCQGLYQGDVDEFPFLLVVIPLSVAGALSVLLMYYIPVKFTKFDNERKSKKEEKRLKKETKFQLV